MRNDQFRKGKTTTRNNIKKIAALVLSAITLFALCACSPKTEITGETFEAKAKEKGLTVAASVTDKPSNATDVTVVGMTDGTSFVWQIDFCRFPTAEEARTAYTSSKAAFDESSGTSSYTERNGQATYEKNGDGKFMYVSQVGTTLVYVNIPEQYKSAAKDFISAIGY